MDRKKLSEIGRTIPAAHPDSSTQWEAHIVMSPEERRELVSKAVQRFQFFIWSRYPEMTNGKGSLVEQFIENEGL